MKNTKEILRALELRKVLSGAAVKKLYRFRDHLTKDGTIKNSIQYAGAHTLRWAGRGIQPHNFPRISSDNFQETYKSLINVATDIQDTPTAFKLILRQLIIPRKGYRFLIGDFASIEARVLAWLANDQQELKQYRNNVDAYRTMASRIYKISYNKVTDFQRKVGKKSELGLGYGMGHKRFFEECKKDKIPMTLDESKRIVDIYRGSHEKAVNFWYTIERAFRDALRTKKRVTVDRVSFLFSGSSMKMTLPSGRIMYYYKPFVDEKGHGRDRGKLKFYNPQHGITGIWGGLIVENIDQGTSRDIMAEKLLECNEAPILTPLLTVHDEIINECKTPKAKTALKIFKYIMSVAPAWADGLPLGAECVITDRYKKI